MQEGKNHHYSFYSKKTSRTKRKRNKQLGWWIEILDVTEESFSVYLKVLLQTTYVGISDELQWQTLETKLIINIGI